MVCDEKPLILFCLVGFRTFSLTHLLETSHPLLGRLVRRRGNATFPKILALERHTVNYARAYSGLAKAVSKVFLIKPKRTCGDLVISML